MSEPRVSPKQNFQWQTLGNLNVPLCTKSFSRGTILEENTFCQNTSMTCIFRIVRSQLLNTTLSSKMTKISDLYNFNLN